MDATQQGLKLRLRRISRQIDSQHRHLREFRLELTRVASGHPDDALEAARRYQRSLDAHFELEEGLFFPALHGYAPEHEPTLRELEREHVELTREIQQLCAAISDQAPGVVEALERFLARLQAHERGESELWQLID